MDTRQEQLAEEFFRTIVPAGYINVGIDKTMLMFSKIDSNDRLMTYYSNMLKTLSDPSFIEKTIKALGGFTPVSNAVGLGAVMIYLILRSIMPQSSAHDSSPADDLRNVFAEEKSSRMRDLIDEFLKCWQTNLHNDHKLLNECERLGEMISLQETTLRNSILGGHVSSPAVKQWVNGVVFHIELLLQTARLSKKIKSKETALMAKETAKKTVEFYHGRWKDVLKQYKAFKGSIFRIDRQDIYMPFPRSFPTSEYFTFSEQETNCSNKIVPDKFSYMREDGYINYIFSKHKDLREIESYFSDLQKNFEILLNLDKTFQLKPSK